MSVTRAAGAERCETLAELVDDFKARLGPEGPLENGYMEWMRESRSLTVAIDRAVMSVKPNGKMHNHQSRVPRSTKLEYAMRLKDVTRHLRACKSFDALLTWCADEAIPGIGPVTQYDVAQRIGEYLGLLPEYVYLHAGVRLGATALGLNVKGKELLLPRELPSALRRLTANETEDFLCTYRSMFPKMRKEVEEEFGTDGVRHE